MEQEIIKAINLFDDVGVWAITDIMILDYLTKQKNLTVTKDEILNSLNDMAAADMIVWDATRSYVRPISYIKNLT